MMQKPEDFNVNGNYVNLKAAKLANKTWYKNFCRYYKEDYNSQINQENITLEQKAHIFDRYQTNLVNLKKIYKQNIINLKNRFVNIKTKTTHDNKNKTFLSVVKNRKKSIWQQFVSLITNKQVIIGVFFTIFLIVIFHIASTITLPGVEIPAGYNQNDFVSMLNLLAGGGLSRMSFFAVGVGPYITAQIIIQLLSSDLIPPLSRLSKQGERGKRKLEVITRIVTLPFCLVQSYASIALILSLNSNAESAGQTFSIWGCTELADLNAGQIIALMATFTGGSYIALFFGDMITKRGVGNGITVIILCGILANLFGNFNAVYHSIESMIPAIPNGKMIAIILAVLVYIVFYILVLLVVIFINNSIRKIPIQQTGQGLTSDVKALPYLPIKLDSAGVIPVIFASSVMTIPSTIAQFMGEGSGKTIIDSYFSLSSWLGIVLYFFLIILFTFFYSYIQLNPIQMQENFEKSGKFIPGVKSGDDTGKHITKVLNRINWVGGPFLAIIATLPYFISKVTAIPSGIAIGGTGIIITVSASIEIWNSIQSAATTTGYEITRSKIQASYYDLVDDKKIEELW